MTNKASLLLAALLAMPAVAIAQTAPTPPSGAPVTPPAGARMRHDFTFTQADMAKLKAEVDKMRAAHKATRAKILAALTPAHRAWLANLLGQLAISPNPDPEAARAKIDATLSATEKTNILAIHKAAMGQMMSHMKTMMPPGMGAPMMGGPMGGQNMWYKRVMIVKDANGHTATTSSSSSDADDALPPGGPPAPPMPPMAGGDRHVTMFMRDDDHSMQRMTMTAGEILMHRGRRRESFADDDATESFGHGLIWRHLTPDGAGRCRSARRSRRSTCLAGKAP